MNNNDEIEDVRHATYARLRTEFPDGRHPHVNIRQDGDGAVRATVSYVADFAGADKYVTAEAEEPTARWAVDVVFAMLPAQRGVRAQERISELRASAAAHRTCAEELDERAAALEVGLNPAPVENV